MPVQLVIKREWGLACNENQAYTVALQQVRHSSIANQNVFAALMVAVEVCSLGQLTDVLL